MVRAFVLYAAEPDQARYVEHVELDSAVCSTEFKASGIDAVAMGVPFEVFFADVD